MKAPQSDLQSRPSELSSELTPGLASGLTPELASEPAPGLSSELSSELPAKLWHVTVTMGGEPMETSLVRAALERLSGEQPFLLSGRYGHDRAEVRYWEEAPDCGDAAALALRLWGEHRGSAGLPDWKVLGVEVVDRELFQSRGGDSGVSLIAPAGGWRPF